VILSHPLLFSHQCHRLHVDFTHITKFKFDLYCNRILSWINARIVSLTLNGNNSSTPGQLTLFLSRFHPLASVFTKLESFKLIDFNRSDVQTLLPYLPEFIHLKCLSIGDHTCLAPDVMSVDELFNEDVVLPTFLRSLAFPYEVSKEWIDISNRTTSYVQQLHAHLIHIDAFPSFFRRFSHLERLTAVIDDCNLYGSEEINLFHLSVMSHPLRYLNVNIAENVSSY
jgi:hypothetical protein